MTPDTTNQQLTDLHVGELDESAIAELQAQLADDDALATESAELEAVLNLLAVEVPAETPTQLDKSRVAELIAAAELPAVKPSRPWWPVIVPLAAAAAVVFMGTWLNRPQEPKYRMAAAESTAPDEAADEAPEVLADEAGPSAETAGSPVLTQRPPSATMPAAPAPKLRDVTLADEDAQQQNLLVTAAADPAGPSLEADVEEATDALALQPQPKRALTIERNRNVEKAAAKKKLLKSNKPDDQQLVEELEGAVLFAAQAGGGRAAVEETKAAADDFAADVRKAAPNDPAAIAPNDFNDDPFAAVADGKAVEAEADNALELFAIAAPAQATRSPTEKPGTSFPSSSTLPAIL